MWPLLLIPSWALAIDPLSAWGSCASHRSKEKECTEGSQYCMYVRKQYRKLSTTNNWRKPLYKPAFADPKIWCRKTKQTWYQTRLHFISLCVFLLIWIVFSSYMYFSICIWIYREGELLLVQGMLAAKSVWCPEGVHFLEAEIHLQRRHPISLCRWISGSKMHTFLTAHRLCSVLRAYLKQAIAITIATWIAMTIHICILPVHMISLSIYTHMYTYIGI